MADCDAKTGESATTLLHGACSSGFLSKVKFRIENVTSDINPLLHCTCAGGRLDVIKFLIENGVAISAETTAEIPRCILRV